MCVQELRWTVRRFPVPLHSAEVVHVTIVTYGPVRKQHRPLTLTYTLDAHVYVDVYVLCGYARAFSRAVDHGRLDVNQRIPFRVANRAKDISRSAKVDAVRLTLRGVEQRGVEQPADDFGEWRWAQLLPQRAALLRG